MSQRMLRFIWGLLFVSCCVWKPSFCLGQQQDEEEQHDDDSSNATMICDLALFVPFTYDSTLGTFYQPIRDFLRNGAPDNNNNPNNKWNNLGFSQMASALLAMKHFNDRDPVVVPQLANLSSWCDVKLSIRGVYDSSIFQHDATFHMFRDMMKHNVTLPCAMVGGFDDLPAQNLGTIAAGAKIPLTSYRSYDLRATNDYFAPYTTQVYPDTWAFGGILVKYLRLVERDASVAFLLQLTDTAKQMASLLAVTLDAAGIDHREYVYHLHNQDDHVSGKKIHTKNIVEEGVHTVHEALQQLEHEGYRTIVCILDRSGTVHNELQYLADAAEKAGINGPGYVWIFLGIDLTFFTLPRLSWDNLTHLKLLVGSALIAPVQGMEENPSTDPFFKAWNATHVNHSSLIERLNRYVPPDLPTQRLTYDGASVEEKLLFQVGETYFQDFPPAPGDGHIYDAVMATGLGACLAASSNGQGGGGDGTNETRTKRNFDGTDHLRGIQSSEFEGATGWITFLNDEDNSGRRDPSYARYGVVNLLPFLAGKDEADWVSAFRDHVELAREQPYNLSAGQLFTVTHTLEQPTSGRADSNISNMVWRSHVPFVFRSGSTENPMPLRTQGEQNYIKPGSRIGGLTLMSIAILACLASAAWLFVHRKHRVVTASQPIFMYIICLGSCIQALAMLSVSFDEGAGVDDPQLDVLCMVTPWLFTLGFMIVYGALFSKLWRVNRVLQFKRMTVRIRQVAWPSLILCLISIGILITMTIMDPLQWERIPLNNATGESIGRCTSNNDAAFVWPLVTIMFIPMFLTALMAFKTKDIDPEFAESRWIFVLIVVQFEIILVGLPVLAILQNLHTAARYWSSIVILFTFPASTLFFIMVPKIWSYRKIVNNVPAKTRGRHTGQVHVTGVEAPSSSNQQRFSSNPSNHSDPDNNSSDNNNAAKHVSITSPSIPPPVVEDELPSHANTTMKEQI